MLYHRYSSPMDLMARYINQRRFGAFVHEFIQAETKRRQDEEEKDNEWKLWFVYIQSGSNKCFNDWRDEVMSQTSTTKAHNRDHELTDDGISSIIGKLFPS